MLFELDPKDATDGIALKNYSSKTIDIDGYVVKNSSGKEYKFEPLKVSSGNTVALVKKTDPSGAV